MSVGHKTDKWRNSQYRNNRRLFVSPNICFPSSTLGVNGAVWCADQRRAVRSTAADCRCCCRRAAAPPPASRRRCSHTNPAGLRGHRGAEAEQRVFIITDSQHRGQSCPEKHCTHRGWLVLCFRVILDNFRLIGHKVNIIIIYYVHFLLLLIHLNTPKM